jgi:hypothetical protein
MSIRVVVVVSICLSTKYVEAFTTIDTTVEWNGTSSTGTFNGGGPRRAGGQTFVVGADNVLFDFTMFADGVSPTGATLKGYIMRWDGEKPFGPVLYESSLRTLSQLPEVPEEPITFNTGGIVLTQGDTYIAFLDAGDVFQEPGAFNLGITSGSNPYPNGSNFESPFEIDTFSELSTVPWREHSIPPGGDAAFIAHFYSAVPESATCLILLLGGALLSVSRLSRKVDDVQILVSMLLAVGFGIR